jgi:two-component system sensor histidine kinase KdpD
MPSTTPDSLATWVAANHTVAAERVDGTTWVGTGKGTDDLMGWSAGGTGIRTLLVPLMVREQAVGVLHLLHLAPFGLDRSRERFLCALSYYAALGVLRLRLAAEAERAEAFRQADALKTALIATVSHDLRTPLTTIKALARGLAEQGQPQAASIEAEADRLNRFVTDLLDLSRIAANAVPLELAINAADDLVGVALQRVHGAMNGRTIRVVRDGQGPLFGMFDLVQSSRVLVNLLENALKYAGSAAEPVELRVERLGATLRFVVADRGPGVPRGESELIFQSFYRPAASPPDVGGAGLGLAIARGLATAQNGTVRFEPRPGGGSIFTFEIPAADPPSLDPEIAPAS